jgi:hypothetical protein
MKIYVKKICSPRPHLSTLSRVEFKFSSVEMGALSVLRNTNSVAVLYLAGKVESCQPKLQHYFTQVYECHNKYPCKKITTKLHATESFSENSTNSASQESSLFHKTRLSFCYSQQQVIFTYPESHKFIPCPSNLLLNFNHLLPSTLRFSKLSPPPISQRNPVYNYLLSLLCYMSCPYHPA